MSNPGWFPAYFSANWEFRCDLGEGGQGRVARVVHKTDGRHAALKVVTDLDHAASVRFATEIGLLRQIHQPAIVRLLDSCEEPGSLGNVTPLGRPLNKWVKDLRRDGGGPDRYREAIRIVRCLAEGLTEVHARGFVHRDIKPANVLIFEDSDPPQPVLIDFGLLYDPAGERVTDPARPAVNRFAALPAASYGEGEIGPSFDCVGLAWLLGYLLETGRPKNERFHWKYHPLVEGPLALPARALLAACSTESSERFDP